MAAAPIDSPTRTEILALLDEQGRLALRVTPGARAESVQIEEGKLRIKLRARALEGRANQAAIERLAEMLAIPKTRITLLRGATSREKLFKIAL